MAKKCPKNFTKLSHQKTLAESWLSQKNASPRKRYDKNRTDGENIASDEYVSEDNDFVPSSQDTTASKLRTKINQTLPKRSTKLSNPSPKNINQSSSNKLKSNTTPQKTPSKLSQEKLKTPTLTPNKSIVIKSSNGSDKQLSIGDICEVNSSVIKEEIDEMFQNGNDFDSIEMMHDLSGMIAGVGSLPTIIDCSVHIESADERESNLHEEQDPLYNDENDENDELESDELESDDEQEENSVLIKNESRKRRKSIDVKKERKKQRVSSDSENDELTEENLKLLSELHIKLQHEVPPQHKIENCAGSRPLNKKQTLLFEAYGPLKKGPFAQTEDEIIEKNWKNFCEVHDWNEKLVEPFLNMRHKGKYYMKNLEERKNFVRFLSNGLPWRSLYSVYGRFKNVFNPANISRYTKEEDAKIIKYFNQRSSTGNQKCAELAILLNRKRHSIWQRYQKLKPNTKSSKFEDSHESEEEVPKKKKKNSKIKIENSHESEEEVPKKNIKNSKIKIKKSRNLGVYKKVYKEVKWSYPLVSRFIQKLMEIMCCTDVEELKNQKIDDEIWKKMQSQISIADTVLQKFWNFQLHMQLFCPKPIYLNDLKMDLIEYLYKNKISSESIEWDKVKLDFTGVTPAFLSKLFDHLVNYVKTKFDNTDIKIAEIIEYLYNTHIQELEEKTTDAILPKLQYKSGRLTCLDKGSVQRPSKGSTTSPLSDEEYC